MTDQVVQGIRVEGAHIRSSNIGPIPRDIPIYSVGRFAAVDFEARRITPEITIKFPYDGRLVTLNMAAHTVTLSPELCEHLGFIYV